MFRNPIPNYGFRPQDDFYLILLGYSADDPDDDDEDDDDEPDIPPS